MAALLGTLLPAALASLMLALSARFSFETLVSLPMLLLFGSALIGKVGQELLPEGLGASVLGLLARSWMPKLMVLSLVVALLAIVLLSYRVTARTFAHYTPESDHRVAHR